MEGEKKSITKAAMNYGAILGLGLVIISIVFYFFGKSESQGLQYLGYLVIITSIVIGIKNYRDNELEGLISYGKALHIGTLISLFGSIIIAFYLYVLLTFIDNSLMDKMLETSRQAMEDRGMTDEQLEIAIKYQKMVMTPMMFAIATIISYTIVGFLFSLIIAGFLKKKNPQENFPQ